MRTIFVYVAIIIFVAVLTEGRRRSCNRKTLSKWVMQKNNRLSRETFETVVAGRAWMSIYTVNLGELVATFGKNIHRHTFMPDGSSNHVVVSTDPQPDTSNVEGVAGCVTWNLTNEVRDNRVCRNGQETFITLNTFFDVGDVTLPGRSRYFSQDPSQYIIQYTCVDAVQSRRCNRGFIFIQIADTRDLPCDEVDLSGVPWHMVAYDLYSLTGLKFGDPRVRYIWLGPVYNAICPQIILTVPRRAYIVTTGTLVIHVKLLLITRINLPSAIQTNADSQTPHYADRRYNHGEKDDTNCIHHLLKH